MARCSFLAGIQVRARTDSHKPCTPNEQTEFSFHVPWAHSPSIASFSLPFPTAVSSPALLQPTLSLAFPLLLLL